MQIGKTAVNLGLALLTFAGAAFAVGAPGIIPPAAADNEDEQPLPSPLPYMQPGQALVRLRPGADAAAIAAHYGIQIGRRLRYAPNTVVFTGITANLEQAIAQLNATAGVEAAQANWALPKHALPVIRPNDEFTAKQWALRLMNAPPSWGIAVGERFEAGPIERVIAGVIDGGFDPQHEDLAANMHPDSYNFIVNAPLQASQIPDLLFDSHATSVSGCLAGVTNNGRGISSLPFEGVQILGCEVGIPGGFIDIAAATDAVYFCLQEDAAVINMSFGGKFTRSVAPVFGQAVEDAYRSGVIVCASTGNSRVFGVSPGVSFPANMPEVIPVGAVGPSGSVSFFSDAGIELQMNGVVAPGGDASRFFDETRLILMPSARDRRFTFGAPDGYEYNQGTSMSSPYAAGAVSFLLTQGARDPEVTGAAHVERLRDLLRSTAVRPTGGPTEDLGAGVVNVEAALRRITPVIDLEVPFLGETTASASERILGRILPLPGESADDSDIALIVNGRDVTDDMDGPQPPSGTFDYSPDEDSLYARGRNTINIRLEDQTRPELVRSLEGPAEGFVPARAFTFAYEPRLETPGVKMISIPYELEDPSDADFLFDGQLRRLARWLPNQNRYAIWDPLGSPQDDKAALDTDDAGVPNAPIGVGFWARIDNPVELQIHGQRDRRGVYPIPMSPGFNLIGNPYPVRIPLRFVSVRFGNEVLSMTEAAQRRIIASSVWRYVDGRYSLATLTNGELNPWEGHWMRNTSGRSITLLVPNAGAPASN